MAVEAEAGGFRVVDEDWLDIVERCLPDALDKLQLEALRRALDPREEARGRPGKNGVSREQLVRSLRKLATRHHEDKFLNLLALRVASRSRFCRADYGERDRKISEKHRRDMLLDGLYDEFFDLLTTGAKCVRHEIIGEVEVPSGPQFRTRSEKAAEMTREWVSARFEMGAPSVSTIINRVSASPGRKRRPRS